MLRARRCISADSMTRRASKRSGVSADDGLAMTAPRFGRSSTSRLWPRRVSAPRTALAWLRERRGLVGTKEGCAEGDCGACTAVLADLHEGKLRYQPVNTCILCVGALDGRELITVEALRTDDGALHPMQKAMVD